MASEKTFDTAILVTGSLLMVSSLTTWIRVSVLGVNAMDSWWGFATLVSGALIALHGASRIWPGFISSAGFRNSSKMIALAGCAGAIAVLGYVGVRVVDLGRQFDSSTNQTATDTGDFGEELQAALDEFTQSIEDAFTPTLAFGWYLGAASSVAASVLVLRSRNEDYTAYTDLEDLPPPSV